MKTVTYYDVATGQITGTSTFHDIYQVTVPEGEDTIQGAYDGQQYYAVDGVPVEYPPKPHEFVHFDYALRQWYDYRTLPDAKDAAKVQVMETLSAKMAKAIVGYTREEVLAFGSKLAAARRMAAGGPDEAIITTEAATLGVTPAVLTAKIVAKGTGFEALTALSAGIRGKTYKAVDEAMTVEAVDALMAAVRTQIEAEFP